MLTIFCKCYFSYVLRLLGMPFFLYLHLKTWNLNFIFSMWFATVTSIDLFGLLFIYPIGLPWSTRRKGWSRRKGRKGDLSISACACLLFLLLSVLLFSLCDSFIHLIFLHLVLQKHAHAWSKESGLQRGMKKAIPLEIRALSSIEENYNPQIARLQFFNYPAPTCWKM